MDWFSVRAGLPAIEKPADRVAKVRELLKNNPEDPAGRALFINVLLDAGQIDEAMAVANRLRRDELAGPDVLATLCDLQAEVGLESEAKRTCSELVEYNPDAADARQMLGDLFLRHGWFDAAYRQYSTLVELNGDDPVSLLRLAIAAAGMGREDEALRIERKVASGDGEIGPNDPRRFARLLSAVKLAMMLEKAPSEKVDDATGVALERALKRTQNFNGPATMTFLVWNDFEVPLSLAATVDKVPFTLSDSVRSQAVGLMMIDVGPKPPQNLTLEVKIDGPVTRRPVPFKVVTIVWDGTRFQIRSQQNMVLKPGTNSAQL
ncbi:MAG: hypothetical protein JXX14_16660 [Deltaproteobacteria bacterium]|nr:hypothetical protein [Deltaproteobacteria bacterium]